MKNTLVDVHNILLEQLERLNDEDLSGDLLNEEIKRADAMSRISDSIARNASISLSAYKFSTDNGDKNAQMPDMLEVKR